MKKKVKSRAIPIVILVAAVLFLSFIVVPIFLLFIGGVQIGNVALIPIEGTITGNGGSYLGQSTVSSKDIVSFIKDANEDSQIKVIILEINSPGGGAVASDEISSAVKKVDKPVIAVIREVGASGGYWIASSTDYIFANRMSITGSIGVISSYLEFSGLMEDYGVGYERMVAGDRKDLGSPFKQLTDDERKILQNKLDKIHGYFIQEISNNRGISESAIRELATGEFYLGVEALQLGLVDELGNLDSAKDFIQESYGVENVEFVKYQKHVGIIQALTGVFSNFFFNIGEGFGAIILDGRNNHLLLR
jgi:protease IV